MLTKLSLIGWAGGGQVMSQSISQPIRESFAFLHKLQSLQSGRAGLSVTLFCCGSGTGRSHPTAGNTVLYTVCSRDYIKFILRT